MPVGRSVTSPSRLAKQREKQRRAVEALLSGQAVNYDEVAKAVGYSDRGAAYYAVHACLNRQEAESVAELRALENARIDALQHAYWKKALDGDLKAAGFVLRLLERRARLNGLDAEQATASVPPDLTNTDGRRAAVLELRDKLAARLADERAEQTTPGTVSVPRKPVSVPRNEATGDAAPAGDGTS